MPEPSLHWGSLGLRGRKERNPSRLALVVPPSVILDAYGAVEAFTRSAAMRIDVWHHLIDVMTSAAALIGISIVLWSSRSAGKPLMTERARRKDGVRL